MADSDEPVREQYPRVTLRFARAFASDFKLEEFKSNPHRFKGIMAAFSDSLVKQAAALDLNALWDSARWNDLRALLAEFVEQDGKAGEAAIRSAR